MQTKTQRTFIPAPEDVAHWERLAGKYQIRLPAKILDATQGTARQYMARLGLSKAHLEDVFGVRSLPELIRFNPTWPLYAVVGLLLETKEATLGNEQAIDAVAA